MSTNELAQIDRRANEMQAASTQVTAVEQARAIAEVKAAVTVAQQVPRDMGRAEGEMRDACGRTALASRAFYRVPNRGSGPSVHLARELARIWGNLDYGVREMRRDDKEGMSEIQAFAWDQQTNTRSTRTFQVPHQRMKGGKRQDLTDLGDVYLNNQNIGARAVRECLFSVMPTWFTEQAQDLCRATIENGEGEPLPQRIDKMVQAFHASYGVKPAQIEEKLGRKRGQWDAGDVAQMTIVYTSLSRGEVTVEEEFGSSRPDASEFTVPKAEAKVPEPEQAPPIDVTDAEVVEEEPINRAPENRRRAMFAAFGKAAGFDSDARSTEGRQARLDYISKAIGREVASSNDLTTGETELVISLLEADADQSWTEGEQA